MKYITALSIALIVATSAIAQNQNRKGPPSHADFMERFDTDGDGTISESEKEAAKQSMGKDRRKPRGKGKPPIPRQIIEKFDTDGDGKLTGDERTQAREAVKEYMMTRRFDKDGDGQLNNAERAEAQAFIDERQAEMLERFDEDGDGLLSDEERRKARAAHMKGASKKDKKPSGTGGSPDPIDSQSS